MVHPSPSHQIIVPVLSFPTGIILNCVNNSDGYRQKVVVCGEQARGIFIYQVPGSQKVRKRRKI
jgi:hypothetical protein